MYILTQGDMSIVTNFSSILVETGRINQVTAYGDYEELMPIVLGEYSTKERCQEIVIDIYKAIRRNENTYKMPEK